MYEDYTSAMPGGGMMGALQDLGRWDELAAEVSHEGQARVAIVGLTDSGKRLLLNRLRGWDLASIWKTTAELQQGVALESYGSFVLADLGEPREGVLANSDELMMMLSDPALILYVLDATRGVLAADYRWVARLRAGGRPVLVAMNRIDECDDPAEATTEAARRLGTTIVPFSTNTGLHIEDQLLPALLNAVPRLAVPLGREIQSVRRVAARRVIRQAALFAGILAAQPVPLLDLPFQIMLQSGMVMRVGASFGYAPGGGLNREIIATVASSLALNYLAQSVIKLVPVLGWVISAALAAASTTLIGEAAIQYYAAGCTLPLRGWIGKSRRLHRKHSSGPNSAECEPGEAVTTEMEGLE
jgi:uncharacterized protein (DUF697 family)